MPDGFDAVAPEESVQVDRDTLTIAPGLLSPVANRRRAGEDMALGGIALPAGRLLRPSDIGVLASMGVAEVPVWQRLRVATLSVGEALRPLGAVLESGCVYDSNRYTLAALLKRLDIEIVDLGILGEDAVALGKALRHGARQADMVLCTGALQEHGETLLRLAMLELGPIEAWNLTLGSGHPMAVGRIGEFTRPAVLMWLPEEPLAMITVFYALTREALLSMSGATMHTLPRLRAVARGALTKPMGQSEYLLASLESVAGGGWQVEALGPRHAVTPGVSHLANCVIELGHDQGDMASGELGDVLPLTGLV